jgi:hypothetical protein
MLATPNHQGESIAIDFLGPLNASGNGYKHIMVIIDRFSSGIILVPLRDQFSAKDIADEFLKHYYPRYGLRRSIVSDRDPRFTSRFWDGLHRQIGTDIIMATALLQNTKG